MKRLNLLRNQLFSSFTDLTPPSELLSTLDEYRKQASFNAKELENLYFPAHPEIREMVFRIMKKNKCFK